MSAVVLPLPITRIGPPERCVVTGRTEGVALRPAAVQLAMPDDDPPQLPLTEEGQHRLERRVRLTRYGFVGVAVLGVALGTLLTYVAGGAGGFLTLLTLVLGWIGVRSWRRQELYAVSERHDLLALEIPDERVARELRQAVEQADLDDEVRLRIDAAEHIANLDTETVPLGR